MPPLESPTQETIDIIVPVYRGLAETRRCLESVLSQPQESPYEIVVVDDASPEPELVAYLDELAARQAITLLRQDTNAGFVAAVNRGLTLHPDRDVVLLNSDTEVSGNWLDRLARCAYTDPRIGTATPFSNNATICSYPRFCEENPLPEGLTLAEIDGLFQRANAGRWLEIPTGVGFCLYIRRACVTEIGLFDESRFGLGYGEENDFCMRATKVGWRHLLCADTFVHHIGSVSFSDRAEALRTQAQATLLALHPDYPAEIQEFIGKDPAKEFRLAVDRERICLSSVQALQVVAEQYAVAADLRRHYQQSLAEAAALQQGLAVAERLLNEAHRELVTRDQALIQAQGYVREREADIARAHERGQRLQEALECSSQRVLTLEQQAEAARQTYDELQQRHDALNLRLEQIYGSKSWRYTRFFRKQ
ncbi:MAG: glycosyltransferase [Candidatus Competibacter denitrificans]